MKRSLIKGYVAGALLLCLAGSARAAAISEAEAVALAEWWYGTEISAQTTALPLPEKKARFAGKGRHQVQYLLGRDRLERGRKANDNVVAYVVTFEPSGYVVVAGDDALQPVLAFNATGTPSWDAKEKTYFRHFVGRSVVTARNAHAAQAGGRASQVHTNWARVRTLMLQPSAGPEGTVPNSNAPKAPQSGIFVMLSTALWGQGDHYNEVCVAHCGGQAVPTGCTATAMAIKFRFHQWPIWGNGSHSYSDGVEGTTYNHSVNFGSHFYDWAAMPTNVLSADSSEVANLMYDCGVSVNMDYGLGGSGAWPSVSVMNNNFRYRGTIEYSSGTPSDHVAAIAYSIRCGLPTILCSSDHCVVAAGYRDSMAPYLFLNGGHNNSDNGWYDLGQMTWGTDMTVDHSYPYSSPNNHVYVDGAWGGSENGDLQTPYNTVSEGQTALPNGGKLFLKAGQYLGPGNSSITLNKTMTISSYLGVASIGL